VRGGTKFQWTRKCGKGASKERGRESRETRQDLRTKKKAHRVDFILNLFTGGALMRKEGESVPAKL